VKIRLLTVIEGKKDALGLLCHVQEHENGGKSHARS
jgi:hypothetical protein